MTEIDTTEIFKTDVLKGLKTNKKRLPSKYFYDKKGDELFQKIMQLDEYYLTRKEHDIFTSQKEQILTTIYDGEPFRIIELGAGDGYKTKVLLTYFVEEGVPFTYTPVDISGNVLRQLSDNLLKEIPQLKIDVYQGDYFEALNHISQQDEKDVLFFLGSNVGNFAEGEAGDFLSRLGDFLSKGDQLIMGVDLKKDPSIILDAYNDKGGITREFNLNLLDRINRELDGNFDRHKFIHYPYYNPQTGECRSYLISTQRQQVRLAGEEIVIDAWEAIFMEISKKYDISELDALSQVSGFKPREVFTDEQAWFADAVWDKI